MLRACVLMMAVLGTGATASTQDGAEPVEREVVPAEENAALQYWAIWAHYDSGDWDRLRLQYVQGVPRDALPDPMAERLVEVSRLEHCDFALDLSRGLDTNFVHVEMMHDLTYMPMVDAQVMLQRNRNRDAAERVATAIRLCEHRTQVGLPISSMAASNRLERIAGFIAEHQQRWDEDDRRILGEALARFDEQDPLRSVAAVRGDARFTRDAFLNEVDGGKLDPKTVQRRMLDNGGGVMDLGGDIGGFDGDVLLAELVAPLIREANSDAHARALLKRAILLGERALNELAAAWEGPTPEQAEAALREKIDDGAFGPLAVEFVAYVDGLRPRSLETAELIHALRAWASGETETLELPEEEE